MCGAEERSAEKRWAVAVVVLCLFQLRVYFSKVQAYTYYFENRNNRGRVIIFDIGGAPGGGFGGPGGFGGHGGGFFSLSSSSGLPLLLLLLKPPQDHQNHHQDHQNHHQGIAPLRTNPLLLHADKWGDKKININRPTQSAVQNGLHCVLSRITKHL